MEVFLPVMKRSRVTLTKIIGRIVSLRGRQIPYFLILGLAVIIYGVTYFMVITNNPAAIRQGEDSHRSIAIYLLEHGEYPASHRLPLYPILIAGVYRVFGVNNDLPLIILLGVMSLATIFLVYLIGQRLFGRKAGLLASILLAFEPHLLHNSYSADLPDVFLTFFLTLAVYFTLRCFDPKVRLVQVVVSAGLISVTAWIKPLALYLPFLTVTLFGLYVFKKLGFWKTVQFGAVYLACAGSVIGSIQYRNYLHTGHAEYSTMKGFHFLFYTGAYILAEKEGTSFSYMKHKLQSDYYHDQSIRDLDKTRLENDFFFSPARSKVFFNDALEIMVQNPFTYVYVTMRGIARASLSGSYYVAMNFYPPEARLELHEALKSGSSLTALQVALDKKYNLFIFEVIYSRLFSFLLWSLVLSGILGTMIKMMRDGIGLEIVFLIFTIVYLAWVTGAVGHARYRLPYESLGVVFAGALLTQIEGYRRFIIKTRRR